jgi:HD-like signal output (HDOD) protein
MNRLTEVLAGLDRLEPFPSTAVRVLELALGGADVGELVALIEQDPALAAKVLRLANSARYGGRAPIESVFDATHRLGPRVVANLALTGGGASVYMGYGSSTPRTNESLWMESLYTACFSMRLAQEDGGVDPELAYTIGLLQNLGHVLLDRFLDEAREELIELLDDGIPLLEAEREVLGIDHAQAGARLLRRWGFPERLVRGVRCHHRPEAAGEERLLCALAGLGEELALRLLRGEELRPGHLGGAAEGGFTLPAPDVLTRLDEEVRRDARDLGDAA